MSAQVMAPEQALRWLRWWVEAPQLADASWAMGAVRIDPVLYAALQQCPARLKLALSSSARWPAPPDPRLLPLLALAPRQWQRLLHLVAAVCAGRQPPITPDLDDADQTWCRRLGRALQPGLWLPTHGCQGPAALQGLRLLQAWVGEGVWQRLRLQFPQASVTEAERLPLHDLPARRLAALWQAAGWYVLNSTVQGSLHADPPPTAVQSSPGAA